MDGLRCIIEFFWGHFVAAQLVKEAQKLLQEGGLLGGTAVDRQLRGHFGKSLLERQQLSAGIQGNLGAAAGNGEDPVGKAAEAQNFCVTAGSRAADAAKVNLRQMRGVFRHQQNLLTAIPQGPDAAQNGV